MALTITLRLLAEDRAEALEGEQVLGAFDPRALLAEHPLHPEPGRFVAPEAYGARLLAALGGTLLRERLADLPRAPLAGGALVLSLADPTLAAIPWEYLHTGEYFVALEHALVREVIVPRGLLPPAPDPALPWRLVVMASDPLLQEVRDAQGRRGNSLPLPRLRVVVELDALRATLTAQAPPPPLRWQRIAPTRDALADLATSEPILFHYTGHGSVSSGEPVLCFDDGAGTLQPQPARDLAADLRGRTYAAFLNACRTADSAEPGANLALASVRNGVPAVLGMLAPIRDDGAAVLAEVFYQQLAAGRPLEEALWRARLALQRRFGGDPTLWGIPALYRAAGYALPRQRYEGPPLSPIEPPAPDTGSLQAPERLLGRAVELTEVLRLFVFDRQRIVTIRGPGGMGKTALVHELASRLRFHFRDGVVAVTLALAGEQTSLSAAALRAEVARRIGLRHPAFDDPAATDAQEEALVTVLRGRRVLMIFDNYETVLADPGRDEAEAVQRLVTRLAKAEVGLLFTTRQSPVGLEDEQSYPPPALGEQLGGLDEASAITPPRRRPWPPTPPPCAPPSPASRERRRPCSPRRGRPWRTMRISGPTATPWSASGMSQVCSMPPRSSRPPVPNLLRPSAGRPTTSVPARACILRCAPSRSSTTTARSSPPLPR